MEQIVLSADDQLSNYRTHRFGDVDDCLRCVDCDVAIWNAWKERCHD